MKNERNGTFRATRIWSFALGGIAAGLLLALAACLVGVREPVHEVDVEGGPGEEVVASEAPPPPQAEVAVGVAPGPNYLWVGGYWTRHQDRWFWVHGRWAARPHPNSVWAEGHWDRHPRGGYVWRNGHWK